MSENEIPTPEMVDVNYLPHATCNSFSVSVLQFLVSLSKKERSWVIVDMKTVASRLHKTESEIISVVRELSNQGLLIEIPNEGCRISDEGAKHFVRVQEKYSLK